MDLKATAASLSDIERKTLAALATRMKSPEEIAPAAKIPIDSVRRALSWLSEKGLAEVSETKSSRPSLTDEGKKALERGMPEKRLLNALAKKEKMGFGEACAEAGLSQQEFSAALGTNKRNAFIAIVNEEAPKIMITETGKASIGDENAAEKALREIAEKWPASNPAALDEIVSRGLAEHKEHTGRLAKITAKGTEALGMREFSARRAYNVLEHVPEIHIGKKQPYVQFLNIIRRKLTELGFVEMEAPLVVHEFYNFDVLFQPQNHPARAWTDTYQLKNPQRAKIPDRGKIAAVKAAHETGGVSASSGWRYTWLEEIAEKLMPTAHGTAHSARQLVKGVQVPGKYFAIARCFRPDVLDATHLIEFNQAEGFIAGEELNFTHLLGILEQFAKEIAGAEEVKFIPDYYPFTEPSVQLSARHPKLGWVELGGAGMFRPEILENLGIRGQAIAWGIGIDRLAMFKLGIKDIRHLFSDDLQWLRDAPMVLE